MPVDARKYLSCTANLGLRRAAVRDLGDRTYQVLALLSTIDMKQMGVGLAAAILIDATLIRALLLPALMTTLGRANWWTPRFLRRREKINANEETRVLEPVG